MALPTSGPLSLNNIQTEFGGTNPISLSEYYAGGANVPSGTSGTNGPVPSSGAISIANFYGTVKEALGVTYTYRGPVSQTFYEVDVLSLAYNGSVCVAVGPIGSVATSSDNGVTWTPSRGIAGLPDWGTTTVDVVRSNGSIFLAGGGSGRLASSTDGVTWTYQNGLRQAWGTGTTLLDLFWDGARFIAYGRAIDLTNAARISTSTDGITWSTPVTTGIVVAGGRIAYSETIYVFTAGTNSRYITSTDLITFTSRTVIAEGSLTPFAIAWSGSAFLVSTLAENPPLYSSTNGITWTNRTTAYRALASPPEFIEDIYWSGTEFIISGTPVTNPTFATANASATTFTIGVATGAVDDVRAVVKIGSNYVFGGNVIGRISYATSLLGTYTSVDMRSNGANISTAWNQLAVNGAAWNGSIYMIVGPSGIAATSPNGTTWTYRTGLRATSWGTATSITALTNNGSTFLVGGGSGRAATTTDGVTWTYRDGIRTTAWSTVGTVWSVVWTGSLYVAIGVDKYATSPDGATWTYSATKFVRAVADIGNPNAMIWTGTRLVVGSADGHVYTSTSATTGTPNLASVAGDLTASVAFRQFAWNGTTLVAATSNGMYSSTGTFATWTRRDTTLQMNGVVYNTTAGQFVAVGDSGVSLYSTDGITWSIGSLSSTSGWTTLNAEQITTNGTNQYVVAGDYAQMATSL